MKRTINITTSITSQPPTVKMKGRVGHRWRRLRRFALFYRAVLVVAIATAYEASASVSQDDQEKSHHSFSTHRDQNPASTTPSDNNRPGIMLGFELTGGTGGTTTVLANRAARRGSAAYSTGTALAEFGWGRKDGASFGLAAEMVSIRELSPLQGSAREYEGAGVGPFVRYGSGRFFATGVLAAGSFSKYGDPERGGYGADTAGDYDDNSRHPNVNFASAKLGLGFALIKSPGMELALTAAMMPAWTDAPHGEGEMARRFASSEFGLALNFYPRPEPRESGEGMTNFSLNCARYSYTCGEVAVHGTKAILDAGSLLGRGLAEALLKGILRH